MQTMASVLLALGVAVLLGGAWMTARYRAFSADHHSASPEVRDHQELAGWLAQRVPEEDVVAIFDDTHWPTLYHYAGRRVVVVADDAELEVVLREPRQDIVDWIHVEHSAPPKWALARRGARMSASTIRPAPAIRANSATAMPIGPAPITATLSPLATPARRTA